MKKVNLLSKAEMKKVMGGDPGPGGLCVPTIYCMSPSNVLMWQVPVPDCEMPNIFGACYLSPDYHPLEIAVDLSYCDACN